MKTFFPAAACLLLAGTAVAAELPVTVAGVSALAGAPAGVSATLAVAPGPAPGTTVLDVQMTRPGTAAPIRDYAVEMEKRLHLIAVSADGRRFLHEHGDAPARDGHFRIPIRFPFGGAWRVYADAVPRGLGQQVMRFDLSLAGPASSATTPAPPPGGLEGTDGRYGARFTALELRAGEATMLDVTLLRDGKPAPDATPYLGVAAHAVLIDAADGTYVHVHAASATEHAHAAMGHAAPPRPGARVDPALAMHLAVPKAGTYLLWLQFKAGGTVRTVPFVVKAA